MVNTVLSFFIPENFFVNRKLTKVPIFDLFLTNMKCPLFGALGGLNSIFRRRQKGVKKWILTVTNIIDVS